jgi:hypothetical protein
MDQSGGEFATMSKILALQVSQGSLLFMHGVRLIISCTLCRYRLIVHHVNINKIPVCRLKIYLFVECIIIMRLISWIHSCGSETVLATVCGQNVKISSCNSIPSTPSVSVECNFFTGSCPWFCYWFATWCSQILLPCSLSRKFIESFLMEISY